MRYLLILLVLLCGFICTASANADCGVGSLRGLRLRSSVHDFDRLSLREEIALERQLRLERSLRLQSFRGSRFRNRGAFFVSPFGFGFGF